MLHHNHSSISVFRSLSCLLILFFAGVQSAWSATEDCSQANIDCRGPVVGPYSYYTGQSSMTSDGYFPTPEGAAASVCPTSYSGYCSCELLSVNDLPDDGGHAGAGSSDVNGLIEQWVFGELWVQALWNGTLFDIRHYYPRKMVISDQCDPNPFYDYNYLGRMRTVKCPAGYWGSQGAYYCYKELDGPSFKPIEDRTCKVGNPIFIGTGNKQQVETDYQSSTLSFVRTYNSKTIDAVNGEPMGSHWRHNYDRYLSIPSNATGSAYGLRHNGNSKHFKLVDGVAVIDPMIRDRLEQTDTGWKYKASNDEVELYDDTGRLISITNRAGQSQTFSYDSSGRVSQVSDHVGRILAFTYDSDSRTDTMTDPEGGVYTYEYDDNNNLSKVIYPDATPNDLTDNPEKTYHYEDTRFPNALTGITDENGNRYATWEYDEEGRAISSEHAGGTERTIFSFNEDGSTTITNALGKQTTYRFADVKGYRYVASVEGHQTNYCAGANKSYSYDANGNVISKTDWNGVTTTYTYDMERNLELTRTEAVGTPQERTTTTEWHTDFRLPTKITEPGRVTEYIYDENGRRLSSAVRGEP